MSEAREFEESGTEYTAHPLEDNIFEWHFTLRGPSCSEFQQGIYHGRILLPAEYPFRPPDVMLMTPNGRWELNKKICLTFTGFHEEMWQPAWGIRTALIGVQAFMGARAEAAIGVGSLDYPEEEREKLAKKSQDWICPICRKKNSEILSDAETARKEEKLPDGLTIDPRGEAKVATEKLKVSSLPDSPEIILTASESSHHTFGPSGPPDSLLASLVNDQARLDADVQNISTTTSCVTSGAATPIGRSSSSINEDNSQQEAFTATTSSTIATSTSLLTLTAPSDDSNRTSPINTVAPRILHSTSEPERRLAVLDRAIATVLFLLLALVLRRALNAL